MAETWMKIKLTERPYYDPRTGKPLTSIEGRRNRRNAEPFAGGGKDGYPAIKNPIEAYEKGTTLLIKADVTADKVVGEVITDEQAQVMKIDVFGIQPVKAVESGVTK